MTKTPEFFPRFIEAIFRRGKAEALPMSYIDKEVERMLPPEERDVLYAEFQKMVEAGLIAKGDNDFYTFVDLK